MILLRYHNITQLFRKRGFEKENYVGFSFSMGGRIHEVGDFVVVICVWVLVYESLIGCVV